MAPVRIVCCILRDALHRFVCFLTINTHTKHKYLSWTQFSQTGLMPEYPRNMQNHWRLGNRSRSHPVASALGQVGGLVEGLNLTLTAVDGQKLNITVNSDSLSQTNEIAQHYAKSANKLLLKTKLWVLRQKSKKKKARKNYFLPFLWIFCGWVNT